MAMSMSVDLQYAMVMSMSVDLLYAMVMSVSVVDYSFQECSGHHQGKDRSHHPQCHPGCHSIREVWLFLTGQQRCHLQCRLQVLAEQPHATGDKEMYGACDW